QHVVEVDSTVEERLDGPALGGGQRLDGGQPIDEDAVAGVGGDAPGAGVRLGDQPLLLERGHVVADGRRLDAEMVPISEGLAADRLAGGNEILDDGPQHLELAFVDVHCSRSIRPLQLTVCALPAGGPRYAATRTTGTTGTSGRSSDLQGGT